MNQYSTLMTSPEIFKKVQESKDQVTTLQQLTNINVKWLVELFYKRNKEFKGLEVPKYKPCEYPVGNTYSTLNKSQKQVEAALQFYKQGNLIRYEKLLSMVLESIHKDEATLLVKVLTNECDAFYGIPKSVFRKVHPELFSLKDKIIG